MSTDQHPGPRLPVPPPPPAPPAAPQTKPAPAAPESPRQPRRSSALRLADHRGLTGLGAVSLVVFFAAMSGAIDGKRTADGLGWVFGLTFVLCCLIAALGVHTEDLGAVAILPPLAYLVAAIGCAVVRPTIGLHAVFDELLIAMLLGAPWLFLAEALTLATTGMRGARRR